MILLLISGERYIDVSRTQGVCDVLIYFLIFFNEVITVAIFIIAFIVGYV